MNLAGFKSTLERQQPPKDASAPLAALWWAAKGDWDRAHGLVMSDEGGDVALVHAYLHRVEGDLDNARYWYRAAGRAPATGTLDAEWEDIATELLNRS